MGLGTFSNSPSTVASYVSIFETLWKQSGMYEESQTQLHSAEAELDRMKQYLIEVLEEIASFKKNRWKMIFKVQVWPNVLREYVNT
jgi:hypothetical protein